MCGIFGIIGKKQQNFDKLSFCGLGIKNDTRGGDSTGILIDGRIDYGVDKEKLFADFCFKSELLKTVKQTKIAIGHCRKASVGAINLANAHPIVIHSQSDKNKRIVMIHNGTIINHKELAEKYLKMDKIDDYSDSTIMAFLFYTIGPKVFKEYNGAGAFVIVDYRGDKEVVYLFKGKSKNFNTEYSQVAEERPLFWVKTPKGIWFSSIKDSLRDCVLVNNNFDCVIEDIPCNTLYKIIDGEIVSEEEFDRSQNYQAISTVTTSNANNYGYGAYGYASQRTTLSVLESDKILESLFETDIDDFSFTKTNDVQFVQGLYVDNLGKPLTGRFRFSQYGYICKHENYPELCFYHGVMIANETYYYMLKDLEAELDLAPSALAIKYPEILYSLSNMPRLIVVNGTYKSLNTLTLYYNFKPYQPTDTMHYPIYYALRYYEVKRYPSGYFGPLTAKDQLTLDEYKKSLKDNFLEPFNSKSYTYEEILSHVRTKETNNFKK